MASLKRDSADVDGLGHVRRNDLFSGSNVICVIHNVTMETL
jgi:hypothetical protein